MKRALALLLAGVMSLSTAFTPVSAWAAEQTPEVTVEDTVEAASVETQLPGETLVEETGAPAAPRCTYFYHYILWRAGNSTENQREICLGHDPAAITRS